MLSLFIRNHFWNNVIIAVAVYKLGENTCINIFKGYIAQFKFKRLHQEATFLCIYVYLSRKYKLFDLFSER